MPQRRKYIRLRYQKELLEAGCDEAGRGCLAGPVTAAAVILPEGFRHPLLYDSKQLDLAQRRKARKIVEEKALAWAVGFVSPRHIDRINILNASYLAMHRALEKLEPVPEFVIVDGNRFNPWGEVPFACVVKGDSKYASIAAASILAKTHRDEYMAKMGESWPDYGWDHNKGYPTPDHRQAIEDFGVTPLHRKSFRLKPLPKQGELFEAG